MEIQDVNRFEKHTHTHTDEFHTQIQRLTCSALTLQKYFLSASFGSVSLV